MGFYPDYAKHQTAEQNDMRFEYDFSYQVTLLSSGESSKITSLILPEHAQIRSQNEDGSRVEIYGDQRERNLSIYWRTQDMMKPLLYCARNEKTSEIACVASLVPTFEPLAEI